MNIRDLFLASVGVFGLTACETMPSEYAYLNTTPQTVEQWLVECEGNENDPLRKARFCELAEKSVEQASPDYVFVKGSLGNTYYKQQKWADAEKAYSDAIAAGADGEMYGNRALARTQLGKFDMALQDFQTAYRQTNDETWKEEYDVLDFAMDQAIEYNLLLTGYGCRAIQKDSVFDAPNEIAIHVIGADWAYSQGTALPRSGAYQNVTPGTFRQVAEEVFYPLGVDPFTLSVIMWEVDDGGDAVDLALIYGRMAASGAKGGRTVNYAGRTSTMRTPKQGNSPSVDPVHNALSTALKSAFGTENDFMGNDDFTNLVAKDIINQPVKSEGGISYHLKTNHRKDGADCSAYFMVQESPMSDAAYIYAVNAIIDGEDPSL